MRGPDPRSAPRYCHPYRTALKWLLQANPRSGCANSPLLCYRNVLATDQYLVVRIVSALHYNAAKLDNDVL